MYFLKMQKVPFLKNEFNTYSVAEQKDKNRHGPSDENPETGQIQAKGPSGEG